MHTTHAACCTFPVLADIPTSPLTKDLTDELFSTAQPQPHQGAHGFATKTRQTITPPQLQPQQLTLLES